MAGMGILIDARSRFEARRVSALAPPGSASSNLAAEVAPAVAPLVEEKAAKPLTITSKYRGLCTHCGASYRVGDTILWTPGVKGARHPGCIT
jgi:hypothetical protein